MSFILSDKFHIRRAPGYKRTTYMVYRRFETSEEMAQLIADALNTVFARYEEEVAAKKRLTESKDADQLFREELARDPLEYDEEDTFDFD